MRRPLTDRFLPTTANWPISVAVAIAYVGTMYALVVYLPRDVFEPTSHAFILSIGIIGLWRYSWWFTHYFRSIVYRKSIFPRLRRAADALTRDNVKPPRIYVLCTSYRIEPKVTYAVYEGVVRNALDYGVPTTIFASVSDRTDVDVLDQLLADYRYPAGIDIRYMYQRGDGKRSAMAEVLRAIARCEPGPDDLVVFMDGDIRLPAPTFRRSMPFFYLEDDLGALTTNNRAIVIGDSFTREWYDLRYAQRHMLMSSMSLSRRVLVLTGRYSVIRASICTRPDFISRVGHDQINHPRFGTITLLSGDDKSTWFWLLENNWAMRYVPDVYVHGFEELPDPNRFFASTIGLMKRWFGNMFRTSDRAITLGPQRMGLFTWWCLIDQRLSVWTTLVGPTVFVVLTTFVRPSFAFAYLLWIMSTRLLASILLGIAWGRASPLWPVLLYYNQVGGAVLKSAISFRFNEQKWTRQNISGTSTADEGLLRRIRRESGLFHMTAVLALVLIVCFTTGALNFPDFRIVPNVLAGEGYRGDDRWLAATLETLAEGSPVLLPPGTTTLRWRTLAGAGRVTLRGAGADETTLELSDAATALAAGPKGQTRRIERIVCGSGRAACVLNGRTTLRNLTLVKRHS